MSSFTLVLHEYPSALHSLSNETEGTSHKSIIKHSDFKHKTF